MSAAIQDSLLELGPIGRRRDHQPTMDPSSFDSARGILLLYHFSLYSSQASLVSSTSGSFRWASKRVCLQALQDEVVYLAWGLEHL